VLNLVVAAVLCSVSAVLSSPVVVCCILYTVALAILKKKIIIIIIILHTILKFIAENTNLCFAELVPVRNEIVTYPKPSAFQLNVPDEQDHKDDIRNDRRDIHHLNTAAQRDSSLSLNAFQRLLNTHQFGQS